MWPISSQEIAEACKGKLSFPDAEKLLIKGISTDSRKVNPGEMFVAIRGEKFNGHDFVASTLASGAQLALVDLQWVGFEKLDSKSAERCIRVENTVSALRALAHHLRKQFTFPVIAVGGSNGKTTTKEMLAALLTGGSKKVTKTSKSENGFLGLAVTLCMSAHSKKDAPDSLVLEIGIDDKGAMEQHVILAEPDVALLTALGPEHLAGLDNWETAVSEELKLFWNMKKTAPRIWQCADEKLLEHLGKIRAGDTAVVNENTASETWSAAQCKTENDFLKKNVNLLLYKVTEQSGAHSSLELIWKTTDGKVTTKEKFNVELPGLHNAQNFALACATALTIGRSWQDLHMGWLNFTPPEMRSRIVNLSNNNVTVYDDCYNASPSSMKAAFQVFFQAWPEKKKLAVLGDMLDLGSESKKWHLELVPLLKDLNNVHLFFYGEAMYDVFKAITADHNFVTSKNNAVSYLSANEDPKKFLEKLSLDELSNSAILIKGSRGMDLGRVVKQVMTQLGANT